MNQDNDYGAAGSCTGVEVVVLVVVVVGGAGGSVGGAEGTLRAIGVKVGTSGQTEKLSLGGSCIFKSHFRH
ncbi:hypothetical protein E2C01_081572 [Portunus trituberculatus]|uniref:Uncharacterized protein n=1 Tax=Portunus trituberculatus TaxID=210409 RepID=A0A5B7IYI3_PORTR|nr:hypothetical protein [Portunus trituberculatus]